MKKRGFLAYSKTIKLNNIKTTSSEELTERCLTHEPNVDKLYEITIQGSCLHRDPLFQKFLLNRRSHVVSRK